jgi:hypothetical protein
VIKIKPKEIKWTTRTPRTGASPRNANEHEHARRRDVGGSWTQLIGQAIRNARVETGTCACPSSSPSRCGIKAPFSGECDCSLQLDCSRLFSSLSRHFRAATLSITAT